MATRKIIDPKQNGEKVWLKGHAQAIYMSNGSTVEDTINNIQADNDFITTETDPIFLASPAAGITEEHISSWNGKQENISDIETIRQGAAKGAIAVQHSELSSVATSGNYNDLIDKPNIKTINGESILGEGNITVEMEGDFLPVEGGTVTYLDVTEGLTASSVSTEYIEHSINNTKLLFDSREGIFLRSPNEYMALAITNTGDGKKFLADDGEYRTIIGYPVINHGTSDTTCYIKPNIFHLWGEVASLNITLATPDDSTILNEYMLQFTSGTTATVLSLPSNIVWISEPTIEASKTY